VRDFAGHQRCQVIGADERTEIEKILRRKEKAKS
jgi:hypothetical protein